MSSKVKVYKIKDFIRMNESGEIDLDRSLQMVREISAAAAYHAGHNILIDLRETIVSIIGGISEAKTIVMEFVHLCQQLNKDSQLAVNNQAKGRSPCTQ